MINFLSKFKVVSHVLAVGIAGAAAWIVANPAIIEAIVKAYPKASVITTAAGLILAIFHDPKN